VLLAKFDNQNPAEFTNWTLQIPQRTGRHIIYTIWQRVVGSDEAFYSCSDVDFGGGTTPPPTSTTPPPTTTTTTTTTQRHLGGRHQLRDRRPGHLQRPRLRVPPGTYRDHRLGTAQRPVPLAATVSFEPRPGRRAASRGGPAVPKLMIMVSHLEQGRTIAHRPGAGQPPGGPNPGRRDRVHPGRRGGDHVRPAARLAPTAHRPVNAHADHGGMPATSDGEIAALRKATGPDFDRRFLNVLIAHQDDATQLARVETATGSDPDARALADRIDRSRSAQIRQMLDFLGEG
jgi:Domain of unknown function (DUF305)/Lytic polysaccharide mono-oxygenase, cellulose-degrading